MVTKIEWRSGAPVLIEVGGRRCQHPRDATEQVTDERGLGQLSHDYADIDRFRHQVIGRLLTRVCTLS